MNLSAILGPGPLTGQRPINDLSHEVAKYRGVVGRPVKSDAADDLIKALYHLKHFDEAYLLTDLGTGQITWSMGIQKWLGYPDVVGGSPLPPDYLYRHIPESLRAWHQVFINAAILAMGEEKAGYLETRFVIHIPLQLADGQVVLVKEMVMPFSFDEENRIVRLIHSFTLWGDYQGWDAFQPRVFDQEGKREDTYEKIIQKVAGACRPLPLSNNLTLIHFKLLRVITALRKKTMKISVESITIEIDADRAEKRKEDTIRRYLDEIKERLWKLTGQERNDKVALDTILPLERSGFIDVLWEIRKRKKNDSEAKKTD